MAAKKERGRFSLRFNISDPIHLATVELLEKQPDHGKAQYIANAVVFYDTHFADDPQPLRAAAPAIDRAAIEAIVREILLQETRHSEKPAAAPPPARMQKQQRPRCRRSRRRSRNMCRSWERNRRQMMRSSA